MIPQLVAGSLYAFYSAGRTIDNIRYWHDYKRNSGYRPRYPFKRGSMDWLEYGTYGAVGFSRGLKRL